MFKYRVQYDWEYPDGEKDRGVYEDFETKEEAMEYYRQMRKTDGASYIQVFSLEF